MMAAMAPSAWAEKIGVVDMRAVMSQLPQAEAMMQGLQNEFSERVAAVRKIETELKSLAEKQQKDALLMTDDQKTELSRQLESLNADYQLKGKALQEDMKKRQAEEQQKLLIKVDTAIKAVAAAGEYDVILQRQAAVFVKESADISAKVVEEVSKGN
ncbi:OmpH family outer membrane protein [Ferrimonas aestuarii]|uniref:OmpH family outer membrane protein n=1 Tax=Ferrimonas aestuarii TaxID=2569539 RepID=A0A4U1BJX5_9GAMM|nr:OmpH family outer membrane protein [Ferrimonas aestuarii]TKB50865.1 OmpH family outer membrane protein [Ferrimonas aestuarii]